jgi:hypothetical protein
MQSAYPIRKVIQLSFLFTLLTLTGCGGGSSSGSVASYTAAAYFTKTAVGNSWTLSGTSATTSTVAGIPSSSATVSDYYQNTAFANGVETQTDTQTTNGVAAAPTTSTNFIDLSGNYASTTNGITDINLPASFSVGTSWTASAAAAPYSAITGKVAAVGVARTVPGGTFTDCIQIDFNGTTSGSGTSGGNTYSYSGPSSGTVYYSPSVGNIVETSTTSTITYTGAWTGTVTTTSSIKLQPGYVAN